MIRVTIGTDSFTTNMMLQFYVRSEELKPSKKHPNDSGYDLCADINCEEKNKEAGGVILHAGMRRLIHTGVWAAVPEGFELQVRPRSGLALKHGITIVNTPGTVDCSYRGEIGVILQNLGHDPFSIKHGDRIAQLVPAPIVLVDKVDFVDSVEALGVTNRGAGGYGSTGV